MDTAVEIEDLERRAFSWNRIDCVMCLAILLGVFFLVAVFIWFIIVHS
jgi:hypothetical protein